MRRGSPLDRLRRCWLGGVLIIATVGLYATVIPELSVYAISMGFDTGLIARTASAFGPRSVYLIEALSLLPSLLVQLTFGFVLGIVRPARLKAAACVAACAMLTPITIAYLMSQWNMICGPLLLLPVAPLTAWLASRLRKKTPSLSGHCQKCGYNLTGNVSGVCPECGEKI